MIARIFRSIHIVVAIAAFVVCMGASARVISAEQSAGPHCLWTYDYPIGWYCWDINCSDAGGGYCAGNTEQDCYCVLESR